MKVSASKISRRNMLAASVASAAAMALPAYIRPTWAQHKRLVIVNSGGAIGEAKRRALYDPFTQATGIQIVSAAGTDLAKLRAQVTSGDVEWDVTDVASGQLSTATRLGLLERVDETIVDRRGCIAPAMHEYAVGGSVYAGGIAFPTDRFNGNVPKTWVEFWDAKKIPGRRSLRTRIDDVLEIALMGDGVPPSQVYPCDVERAFKALDRIKPIVSHWIAQTEQTVTLIQANETDFTYSYTSRIINAKNVDLSPRQNLLGVGWIAAVKGTKNKDAAMRFLAFTMDRQRQIDYANLSSQAPTYVESVAKVDPSVRKWMPDIGSNDNLFLNSDWWEGKTEELQLRFREWLLR